MTSRTKSGISLLLYVFLVIFSGVYADAAHGGEIIGITKPALTNDSQSRPLSNDVWDISAPPYPFNIFSGIGYIVNPHDYRGTFDFVLHDHVYVSSNVPDPSRSVVTFTFDEPTIVDQIEIKQHFNGISEIEGFVGDSIASLNSIGTTRGTLTPPYTPEYVSDIFDFDNTAAGTIFRFVVTETPLHDGYAAYRAFPRYSNGDRIPIAESGDDDPQGIILVDVDRNTPEEYRPDLTQPGFTRQRFVQDITYDLGGGATALFDMYCSGAEELTNRSTENQTLLSTGSSIIPDGTNINRLLRDFLFLNLGSGCGGKFITFSGLAPGPYIFEAWFYDMLSSQNASVIMYVEVSTDGGANYEPAGSAQAVYDAEQTTSPVAATFTATEDDVVIRIFPGGRDSSWPQLPGGVLEYGQFRLNGFALASGNNDSDGDGINDNIDLCPLTQEGVAVDANGCSDAEVDTDGDGICDTGAVSAGPSVCTGSDNCPIDFNPLQEDADSDGEGDVCDVDDDNDGVIDGSDNCPLTLGGNADQTDTDMDGAGDICDADLDGDGVDNDIDVCPFNPDPDQTDTDMDGDGDACDINDDGDNHNDVDDNCPLVANNGQEDLDGDNIGDACDADLDGDGVVNNEDNCPITLGGDDNQTDTDLDGEGDVCDSDDDNDFIPDGEDNCPLAANTNQGDADSDGVGDACNDADDADGDDWSDALDNCPDVANGDQADFDGDAIGDACDPDVDGDGVDNDADDCAATPLGELSDFNGCTIAQLCPCEGPQGTTSSWKNHGKYVSCVAHAANGFRNAGVISESEHGEVVSAASQSSCGDKK